MCSLPVGQAIMQDHDESAIQQIILDSINDGVFTVDAQWRVRTFNRAAERITGVPREVAIGQPCCEVFRASICETNCALRQTFRSGQPIANKAIYIINAHGQRVPISISTALLRDSDGTVMGGVETFRDLSAEEELKKRLHDKYTFADIIGRSRAMRELFDVLPSIAQSHSTVLIEGASGTGKEMFARALHHLSPRNDRRFVAINCGALPDALLESELFGYKAGAFTDARRDKPGRFTIAEGGTILLDEIGDISPAMQSKLLRVLQERVYEPLGSVESRPCDVRIIAATNRHLDELVRDGTFREDLFYRINVVRLKLPALHDRREDIPLLLEHFVAKYNRLQGKNIAGLDDTAMAVLMEHDYPGNVRELENIIEHAFVLCQGGLIERRHLPAAARGDSATLAVTEARGLRDVEAAYLGDLLRRHRGNRTAVARALGVHPTTLYRKIKALGVRLPATDGRHRGPA
jgi:PAS domain S-box-containing protein